MRKDPLDIPVGESLRLIFTERKRCPCCRPGADYIARNKGGGLWYLAINDGMVPSGQEVSDQTLRELLKGRLSLA